MHSKKLYLILILLTLRVLLNAQADTIFPKKLPAFPAQIKEITETTVSYKQNGSSLTYTIAVKDIEKIQLSNGRIEKYLNPEPEKESAPVKEAFIPKTVSLTDVQKARVEKLSIEAGKKIGKCALGHVQNLSTSIDWTITQYDAFNPPNIIIYAKIYYDRFGISDRFWADIKITLNEESNTIKWKFLNCTNKGDEMALLQCQKKSL